MNAAIRAVTRAAIFNGWKVMGIYRGYEGLINDDIHEMTSQSVSSTIQRGGTILKTARSQEFMTPEGRQKAYDNMQKHGIDALIVIGGNGSLAGAQVFAQEFDVPCIGLPGTIDNDLYGTDSTIGYDTALNTIVECVDKIRDTATSHNRIFFIEVMGRDAGFLAQNRRTVLTSTSWSSSSAGDSARARTAVSSLWPRRTEGPCIMRSVSARNIRSMTCVCPSSGISRGEVHRVRSTASSPAAWVLQVSRP